jgi:hypothetical protein
MYRTCIFCSGDLGTNDAVEEFPVGRSLAFDQWKGRLWAVCPKCSRWNLAPIEERWEAVESAERLFRDSRLRVHSENIGLAKLRDGTRLIRVGDALAGEFAAWRYGSQLVSRRRQHLVTVAAVGAVAAAVAGGLAAAGILAMSGSLINGARFFWENRLSRQPVMRLDAELSPTGEPLLLRRHQLHGARIVEQAGEMGVLLPEARRAADTPQEEWKMVLRGKPAEAVLGRAAVYTNHKGAGRADLERSIGLLEQFGGSSSYLEAMAARGAGLGVPRLHYRGAKGGFDPRTPWRRFTGTFRGEPLRLEAGPFGGTALRRRLTREDKLNRLTRPESIALEMALHEEMERRSLGGELASLEAAWREADEIATIADSL